MAKAKLGHGCGTRVASPVDVHVGARLRQRRTLLGMSPPKLGHAIGVTVKQAQKYERGTNRISASRLFALSRVLGVPVQFFFDDMPNAVTASSPAQGGGTAKEPPSYEPNPITMQETVELVRTYYKITDPHVRERLRERAKALGTAASRRAKA